jgi:AcrR family transcriptional regulator
MLGVTSKSLSGRSTSSPRRAELLSIAAELFATRGFLATTVREIADAAGILSGSLYHHFDSKESMVDEVLREFLDAQHQAHDAVLRDSDDAAAAITGLVRQSFRAVHEHRAAVAVFQNEANYLGQFERFDYLRQATADFERTWTRVLQDGQRSGVFRPDLNVKLVYRFIRDTVWTVVQWYSPRGRFSATMIADQYLEVLCDGLFVPEQERRQES